ncbi:hypothetical protein [Arthrobacter yangruifuii]|uniref:hypothetical protein n=1 Tax=Arthrobacter yangruifuii TaxID=2606616 RepID=UPI0011B81992|nr:hypothetical protein [Arthrobacter yangruifuii]
METARALHQEIQGLAKDAPEQMLPQLKELSSPVENTLVIADSPGSAWTFNPGTWTRAAAELETGCAPYRAR